MDLIVGGGGGGGGAATNPNNLTVGIGSMGRDMALINTVPMAVGTTRFSYFTAPANLTFANIRTWCGSVGGVITGGGYVGLCKEETNGDLTFVNGAVDITLWNTPNTAYTRPVAGALVSGQRYALAVLVTAATTLPTLGGSNQQFAQEMAEAPRMSAQVASQAGFAASYPVGTLANSPYRIYGVFLP
jgi:hypothetical protein